MSQPTTKPTGRRSVQSLACDFCRKHKSKCDGNQPCSQCLRRNSIEACVFNVNSDKRRQRLSTDDIEDLVMRKNLLDSVIDAIRNGDTELLIEKIRNGATVAELNKAAKGIHRNALPTRPSLSSNSFDDTGQGSEESGNQSSSVERGRAMVDGGRPVEISSSNNYYMSSTMLPGNESSTRQVQQYQQYQQASRQGVSISISPGLEESSERMYEPIQSTSSNQPPPGPILADRSSWHPSLQVNIQNQASFDFQQFISYGEDANNGPNLQRLSNKRPITSSPPQVISQLNYDTNSSVNISSMGNAGSPSQAVEHAHRKKRHVSKQVRRRSYRSPPSTIGYARSFGNLSFTSSIATNGYPTSVQFKQSQNFHCPAYTILPIIEVDDSPLGRVYTDFQRYGQELISGGVPASTIAGSDAINVDLYFRDRLSTDPRTASTWASELQRTFGNEFTHTIKLSCVYMLARLMKWLLQPTAENYASIPEMMRPVLRQTLVPHSSAADLIPISGFRDALISNMRDFVGACARAGLDVSWPYTINEALDLDPLTMSLTISDEFASHISQPDNWVVGRSVLEEFPDIVDANGKGLGIRISKEEFIRPVDRWLDD